MALAFDRVKQVTDEVINLSVAARDFLGEITSFLEYNSDQAIDWSAAETPDYIEEDSNGNVAGYQFSRQQVSNAIGSLYWIKQLLTDQNMSGGRGDHLGNFNLVSHP